MLEIITIVMTLYILCEMKLLMMYYGDSQNTGHIKKLKSLGASGVCDAPDSTITASVERNVGNVSVQPKRDTVVVDICRQGRVTRPLTIGSSLI